MLKNRGWERPSFWARLDIDEKKRWHEGSDHLEEFYQDMRRHRHINTGLSTYITPLETESYIIFRKILKNQDNVLVASNMLSKFATKEGGVQRLIDMTQNLFTENYLPHLFLSVFAFVFIQIYETNLNILRKTITTINLTRKNGTSWDKPIENTSPETLFDLLKNDSEHITYLKDMTVQLKKLRNAFSHGLYWFENERINWVEDANNPKVMSIEQEKFYKVIRKQSLFSQCYLWITGKLITERFFEP